MAGGARLRPEGQYDAKWNSRNRKGRDPATGAEMTDKKPENLVGLG